MDRLQYPLGYERYRGGEVTLSEAYYDNLVRNQCGCPATDEGIRVTKGAAKHPRQHARRPRVAQFTHVRGMMPYRAQRHFAYGGLEPSEGRPQHECGNDFWVRVATAHGPEDLEELRKKTFCFELYGVTIDFGGYLEVVMGGNTTDARSGWTVRVADDFEAPDKYPYEFTAHGRFVTGGPSDCYAVGEWNASMNNETIPDGILYIHAVPAHMVTRREVPVTVRDVIRAIAGLPVQTEGGIKNPTVILCTKHMHRASLNYQYKGERRCEYRKLRRLRDAYDLMSAKTDHIVLYVRRRGQKRWYKFQLTRRVASDTAPYGWVVREGW